MIDGIEGLSKSKKMPQVNNFRSSVLSGMLSRELYCDLKNVVSVKKVFDPLVHQFFKYSIKNRQ